MSLVDTTGGHLAISEGTLYIAGADGLLVAINIDPSEPVPDIKANGQDTPLFISKDNLTGELINITVALVPGYMEGRSCDWWVGALAPFGTYWLNPQRNWVKSDRPIYVGQYPLFRFSSFSIFNDTLPTGIYTFFFILDENADGIFDMTWFDYVVVTVTAGDLEQQMDELTDFKDLFRERIRKFMKQ